jgi:hypothetical protein
MGQGGTACGNSAKKQQTQEARAKEVGLSHFESPIGVHWMGMDGSMLMAIAR